MRSARHAFSDDFDEVSDQTGLECKDESLAIQSQKEEADINTLVRRFHIAGEMPEAPVVPSFAMFEDVFDFQTAQNALRQADEAFMEFPAELRRRFDNSPQKLMEFMEDAANLDEARKLGLVNAAPEAQNVPTAIQPK